MNFSNGIARLLSLLVLSSCANTDVLNAPQSVEVDHIRPATSRELVRALDNGILPKATFDKLPPRDRVRALLAEYNALETSPSGKAVAWQSPNGTNSGLVVPLQPYKVGSQNCRQYSHNATISGQTIKASGAACRSPNGKWVPLP